MKDLNECRKIIDEIDSEIIKLFEKRMDVVKNVIQFKISNDIPVLDSSRENAMLEKNIKKINNHEYDEYYKDVLNGFLKASKAMQNDILNKKIN